MSYIEPLEERASGHRGFWRVVFQHILQERRIRKRIELGVRSCSDGCWSGFRVTVREEEVGTHFQFGDFNELLWSRAAGRHLNQLSTHTNVNFCEDYMISRSHGVQPCTWSLFWTWYGLRKHQGMDRPGVHQVPEGSGEQGKMEESCSEIICGVPPSLAVKG